MQGWTTESALEYLAQAKADVAHHHTTLDELNFGVKLLKAQPTPVADMQLHEKVLTMQPLLPRP